MIEHAEMAGVTQHDQPLVHAVGEGRAGRGRHDQIVAAEDGDLVRAVLRGREGRAERHQGAQAAIFRPRRSPARDGPAEAVPDKMDACAAIAVNCAAELSTDWRIEYEKKPTLSKPVIRTRIDRASILVRSPPLPWIRITASRERRRLRGICRKVRHSSG